MPVSEGPREAGIAMWGAPGSGKTTFLAALHTALMRDDEGLRLSGADAVSTSVLAGMTSSLTSRGEFPPATDSLQRLHWTLVGLRPSDGKRRWWWPFVRRSAEHPVRVALNIADSPGEAASPAARPSEQSSLIESLSRSTGIIFCFDPTREVELGDTFDHVAGLLARLSYELRDAPGDRLPHYVAVCVTKFDDLRLLKTAERLRLVEADATSDSPKVPEEEAREFLLRLCRLSPTGTAELVPRLIEQTFYPERVRYFVTSAIGFYVDPRIGAYDPDDQQNVIPGEKPSDRPRVRGAIHPINVVEPVTWLAAQAPAEPPR